MVSRLVRLLRDHVTVYRLHEFALARERGLPSAQLRCLVAFADQAELSAKELTRRLGLSHSRLSHVLESLEAKQLIWRRTNLDDRRVIMVDLSPKGQAEANTLDAELGRRYEDALKGMSPDAIATAITVLARALDLAQPEPRAPPRPNPHGAQRSRNPWS